MARIILNGHYKDDNLKWRLSVGYKCGEISVKIVNVILKIFLYYYTNKD